MKINLENLQLSGKGIIVNDELLHDNMRLTTEETVFHQLVSLEDDEIRHVGWLVPHEYTVDADFIIHTPEGSKGKSTHDTVSESIIFDGNQLFEEALSVPLVEMDISESQVIFDRLKADEMTSYSFQFDGKIDSDAFVILSPRSEFVFVQTEDSTVRIHGEDGVYVLKRDDDKEKLIMIDKNDGVNIYGDKSISIGPGGLIINGEPLNIHSIVGGALGSLSALNNININLDGIEDLSEKMGNLGKKIEKTFSQNFKKNFKKNFGKNFSSSFSHTSFDDDMDDFDDEMEGFDVDIDF